MEISETVWTGAIAAFVTCFLAWNQRKTHNLVSETKDYVNHLMEIQLELHRGTAKRLAFLTRDPEDIHVSDKAEADYQDHMKRKAEIEAKASKI